MFGMKTQPRETNVEVEAKPVGNNCILISIPIDDGNAATVILTETIRKLNTPTRKITSISCMPLNWGYYKAWVTFEGDPLPRGTSIQTQATM
jgi:hypothetical protein